MKTLLILICGVLFSTSGTSYVEEVCSGCDFTRGAVKVDNKVTWTALPVAGENPDGQCNWQWENPDYCTQELGCYGNIVVTVSVTGMGFGDYLSVKVDGVEHSPNPPPSPPGAGNGVPMPVNVANPYVVTVNYAIAKECGDSVPVKVEWHKWTGVIWNPAVLLLDAVFGCKTCKITNT